MRPKTTRGTCAHCGKEFTKAGMGKHLAKCLIDRLQTVLDKNKPCFHLQVGAKNASAYWLHLQASADATLEDLDDFLRQIWVECCGHLSLFHIADHEIDMSRKLGSCLQKGMEIEYDYDMGATTSLRITVLGGYPGLVTKKKPIEILARNQPPVIICDECGENPAAWICPECGMLCTSCAAEHDCGDEEYLLPVVNSPRTGVCAYTGE